MQRSPQDIKDTLLKALDHDYNVIDMPAVVEIIGILEQTAITKDALETTRLGKYINELRRKTPNEVLAKRAKDLVRKWRDLIHPEPATPGGNGVRSLHSIPNRAGQLSPGLSARMSLPASPSSRVSSLSPDNKAVASPVISPAISPRLQVLSIPQIGRISTPASPAEGGARTPRSIHNVNQASTFTHTPAKPTRGRGRPPKNKNKHKRPLSPSPTTDLVPKTSPANKRLRKDSPEVPTPVRANGVCTPKVVAVEPISEVPSETRKLNRRKSLRHNEEDAVKEAMASIVRTPKVKTTRELLQSIQKESSLDHLRSRTLTNLGVAKPEKLDQPSSSSSSSTEHIHKFLRSQPSPPKRERKEVKPSRTVIRPTTPPSPSGSDIIDVEKISGSESSPLKVLLPPPAPVAAAATAVPSHSIPFVPVKPERPETAEEILAKLPRINTSEIVWSDPEPEDDSDVEEPVRQVVTAEDVERLHTEHMEGLNGNLNEGCVRPYTKESPHGLRVPIDASCGATGSSCPARCQFREWHETLSRVSYNGDLLHILPYVIID